MGTMVRVRYAPSPTGEQHIGGVRTALFNYLHARKMGGRFILRVEDTDTTRSELRFEQSLYRDLAWLGLEWDEGPDCGGPFGPYRQSERGELYRAAVKHLLDTDQAYFCYCTPDELRAEREAATAQGRPPRYSGRCRSEAVRRELAQAGRRPVVRFRVPSGLTITFDDMISGSQSFASDDLGDFVIYHDTDRELSTGRALYNLAVVVDDHAMGINCILRGAEHASNTPRQILLYQALGYALPEYGHMSLILTTNGDKMSKRFGDTSITHYREAGYLPEALLAYMATLGWAPGKQTDTLTLEELVTRFSVRRLSASPSVFDPARLESVNKHYLRAADTARIGELLRPRLVAAYGRWEQAAGTAYGAEEWYHLLVRACQDEATTLGEIVKLSAFALQDQLGPLTEDARQALLDPAAHHVLAYCIANMPADVLASSERAAEFFKELRHHFRDQDGLRGQQVMFPVRAALTGSLVGPCLGIVATLLGVDRCRARLESALG